MVNKLKLFAMVRGEDVEKFGEFITQDILKVKEIQKTDTRIVESGK